MNPEIREITKKWLEENGYDGLYSPGVCACQLSDLMPCDEPQMDCTAGYKLTSEKCEADFHIAETKNDSCDTGHCCFCEGGDR